MDRRGEGQEAIPKALPLQGEDGSPSATGSEVRVLVTQQARDFGLHSLDRNRQKPRLSWGLRRLLDRDSLSHTDDLAPFPGVHAGGPAGNLAILYFDRGPAVLHMML